MLVIEAENWQAWEVFNACRTQWRFSFTGPAGLDYPGVESVCRWMRVKRTPELFEQLRLLEMGALVGKHGLELDLD